MKNENYEIYRNIKDLGSYFSTWDENSLTQLNNELKIRIYEKYILKCLVFQRDGFKCINKDCKHTNSPLTMHHVKFQKNNGKDSIKNCITLCKSCHNGYHRGKNILTFWGATYKIHKIEEINWKVMKKQNKQLRKRLVKEEGISIEISLELLGQLIRFLMTNLDEDVDDD